MGTMLVDSILLIRNKNKTQKSNKLQLLDNGEREIETLLEMQKLRSIALKEFKEKSLEVG